MGAKTGIEWTDATWNPVRGCSRVSEGCRHCYAEIIAARFAGPGQAYEGLARFFGEEARWTGQVRVVEHLLDQPLRWKAPRKVFVNSTSDLFHEAIDTADIAHIFAVMALAQAHTFQVLTKRPARMRRLLSDRQFCTLVNAHNPARVHRLAPDAPLPNLWLGVSVEHQEAADERTPDLMATPAALRFLSVEPMLGPVDLHDWLDRDWHRLMPPGTTPRIDWVICGGESGPGARPMHPDWPRSLRDQCTAAGVPFFFKQWGDWRPAGDLIGFAQAEALAAGRAHEHFSDGTTMIRFGKGRTGCLLDRREWQEMPG